MSIIIKGGQSSNLANVDSNNNLLVNLPLSAATAGYVSNVYEVDGGSLTGTKKMNVPFVTIERRLAVGMDTPLYDYTFNAVTQDTGNWRYVTATMTTTWGTTGMLLNSGSATVANNGTAVSTWKQFNLTGNGSVVVDMTLNVTDNPLANQVMEFGLFPFAAGNVAPTEGAYYRFTNAGLVGAINFNSSETTTAVLLPMSALTPNTTYVFTIRVHERLVSFWKDGVLLNGGELTTPAAQGQPFATTSFPLTFQFRNSGTITGSPIMQAKILDASIEQKSLNLGKPYSHIQTGKGLMGSQGTNGNTMGSTALFTNSLAAGAGAAMTNTTAALGSGLGGQFSTQPTLAVSTDGIVSSFQVPAGSINVVPRTLYITGVKVQGAISTVLGGNATPVHYIYSLAYGHTAVSLATAEAVAAKAPRRIPLGFETPFSSASTVNTIGQGVSVTFNSPIVVNPGEFVAIAAKNIGSVTTSGVVTFLVTFDSYWE